MASIVIVGGRARACVGAVLHEGDPRQEANDEGCAQGAHRLWAPVEGPLLNKLENLQRNFTRKVSKIFNLSYWERLKVMNLQSIQRRFDRYKLIYTWKVINGTVPNCGLNWAESPHNGRMIIIPEEGDYLNSIRRQSFSFTAGQTFNYLPRYMRDDNLSSLEVWKASLTKLLEKVPDCPKTTSLKPIFTSPYTNKQSNSLNVAFLVLNVKYWKPPPDVKDRLNGG